MINFQEPLFELKNITRTYGEDFNLIKALDNVSVNIYPGDFLSLVGPSGSGKSTLLNIMSGLDKPTSGEVYLMGKGLHHLKGSELTEFRRDHIGLIFQAYNLIPVLSVKENVEYIMMLQGVSSEERRDRVSEILKHLGLGDMENRFPSQLSGGQQQRVAIARAMVARPNIILADEPTANLDSVMGSELVDMMLDINKESNTTFVFSTHDPIIMEKAKRIIALHDGKISEIKEK